MSARVGRSHTARNCNFFPTVSMAALPCPRATPLRLVRALYQLRSVRFLTRRPSHVVTRLERVCMLHRFTKQSRLLSAPHDFQDQACGAGSRRAPPVAHDHAAHVTRSKRTIAPLLRNACSVPAVAAGSDKAMLMVLESKSGDAADRFAGSSRSRARTALRVRGRQMHRMRAVHTRSRLTGPTGASGSREGASAASARWTPIRDGVSRGQTSANHQLILS